MPVSAKVLNEEEKLYKDPKISPQATELNYSLFVFGQARAGAPISGFFCPSV